MNGPAHRPTAMMHVISIMAFLSYLRPELTDGERKCLHDAVLIHLLSKGCTEGAHFDADPEAVNAIRITVRDSAAHESIVDSMMNYVLTWKEGDT